MKVNSMNEDLSIRKREMGREIANSVRTRGHFLGQSSLMPPKDYRTHHERIRGRERERESESLEMMFCVVKGLD